MHENLHRLSLWLFRGAIVLFVLAWMLPIGPVGRADLLFRECCQS